MMAKLSFRNLTVEYDEKKISKSSIRKSIIIEIVGALCIFIGLIFIGLLSTLICLKQGFWIILFDLISVSLILGGGLFLIYKIQQKVAPKHFDLVTWLMKFKHNEVEVGWFNDRFVVELYNGRGSWIKYSLQKFAGCDYVLFDNSDKTKSIFMTVDLMTNIPRISITNSK